MLELIKPGMSEIEIVKRAEKFMIEKGIDNFWYHNIGAFVFVGTRTLLSGSGRNYTPSNETRKGK